MLTLYYGEYVSSTVSQTGCIKGFLTERQSSPSFAPQVMYTCSLCNDVRHGFRLLRIHMAATPRQSERLISRCVDMDLEIDIRVQ